MPTAYIGMGGNLPSSAGAPEATLTAAAGRLATLGRVTRCSSLYSTAPVGFAEQPRFVNAVIEIETELGPRELLDSLLAIEQEFGRDRTGAIRNGPRTLDLDLLLFGGVQWKEPGLEIPHPRLTDRAFVLIPLGEIAPSLEIPGSGLSVSEYLHKLNAIHESRDDAPIRIHWDDWPAGACHHGGLRGTNASTPDR